MEGTEHGEGHTTLNKSGRRHSRRFSRNMTYCVPPEEEAADLAAPGSSEAAATNLIRKPDLAAEEQHFEMLVTEKPNKNTEPLTCRMADHHEEYSVQYFGMHPRLLIDMLYERYLDRVDEFSQKLFDYLRDKKGITVSENDSDTYCRRIVDDLDAHFDVTKYDSALKCVFRLPNTHVLFSDQVQHQMAAAGASEDCEEAAIDLQIKRLEQRLVHTRLECARMKADTQRIAAATEFCEIARSNLESERSALNAFARTIIEQYENDGTGPSNSNSGGNTASGDNCDVKRCLKVLTNAADNIALLHEHLQEEFA